MSRQLERYAARHWIDGNEPQAEMERWHKPEVTEHEAIARRLRASYDHGQDGSLPDRLNDLLMKLNRVSLPPETEL